MKFDDVTQEFLNEDGLHVRWSAQYSEAGFWELNEFYISDGESIIYLSAKDVEPMVEQLLAYKEAIKALEVESVKEEDKRPEQVDLPL